MTIREELRALEAKLSAKRDTGNKHHQSNRFVRKPGARGPRPGPFGRGAELDRMGVRK